MQDAELTALATVLLVVVGAAQVKILSGQRQQQRLDWAELYRRRWIELRGDWATIVFLGRRVTDYYQIAHHETLQELRNATRTSSTEVASSWAQASVRNVCGMLSDLCSRVLQGHIKVQEIYPIFGTELLRQGAPFRTLLDGRSDYLKCYGTAGPTEEEARHDNLRSEMTTWLVCHDGIRRRCLIMIDLLWAEAARLEDLPPYDLKTAANAKLTTGHLNRARLRVEALRLGGWGAWRRSLRLAKYLRYAEWRRFPWSRGLRKKRMKKLDDEWTKRYINT
ncbi:hypothetical protein ACS77_09085 [Pseudomonas syringae]|uniref:Uncharacterized protein n=1 Tax=Pseudomonas syringae TaxID=317 RepID=A0A0L1MHU5_PSESX|nr:hypothetical protein ACS77_09085 [Pseudomonas syringae]